MTTVRKYYEADGGQGGYPTAAQKEARRIVEMFLFSGIYFTDGDKGAAKNAKACAIIHVKGILLITQEYEGVTNLSWIHWQQVLSEIEKM